MTHPAVQAPSRHIYVNLDQFIVDRVDEPVWHETACVTIKEVEHDVVDIAPFFDWLVRAPEGYTVHVWYAGCWKIWQRPARKAWLLDQLMQWAQDPRHRQTLAYGLGHGFLLLNPAFAEQLIPQWCASILNRIQWCGWVPSAVCSFDYWAGFIYRFPVLENGKLKQVLRLRSGELVTLRD